MEYRINNTKPLNKSTMTKQDQLKANMIQLQLEIGRDQQVLHETKNRLKDRMAILYALTAELDQIVIHEAEEEINNELAKYNEAT